MYSVQYAMILMHAEDDPIAINMAILKSDKSQWCVLTFILNENIFVSKLGREKDCCQLLL